ncbi:hypothetical protein CBR_g3416 [Chara braunii]|uniref:Reverse transcriptase RNase H-like domain-containing protein n=1 Tax=Chara braunii TaxID=69332 RepID=A0A388JR38_CHABU|nr:hypothetical protein CBR_g3416 [Chara braunii]|eukprot:GBG60172.1 hypothetical protein CBR_g3416 [Chara braunii]
MRRPVRTMRCVPPPFLVDAVFGTRSRLVRICQSMTNLGLYQCAREDFFRLLVEMGPFEGNWVEELAEMLNCLSVNNVFVPSSVHWGIVYRNVAVGETFLEGVRELFYNEEDDFKLGRMATEDETDNRRSEGGSGLGGSVMQSEEGQKDRESINPDGIKGNRKEISSGESSGKVGGSRQGTQETKEGRNKDTTSPRNSEEAVSKKVRVTDARRKLAEIEKRNVEYKARLIKEMMTGNEEDPLQKEPRDERRTGRGGIGQGDKGRGMWRAIIMLNGLEIAVVEAEPVVDIIWDQPRGRGAQVNFILENDGRDRVNATTRLGTVGRRIIRDTVMEEVAGSSVPQAEPEAGEPEKVYRKPREEEPTDKVTAAKEKLRYQIPILTMPEIDDTLSKLLGTMVSVSFQTMLQASPRLLKGLRQLFTRRRVEIDENPESPEGEGEEEVSQEVANLQRSCGDLEDLEKLFADIRLSLSDREGGEVMRSPPGTKLNFHVLPIAEPIRAMMRAEGTMDWTEERERVVQTHKDILTSEQVALSAPCFNDEVGWPFILQTDGGPLAVGGVLIQRDEEGKERSIRFESKTLNSAERRYSQFKKEVLAILHCLKTFQAYLFGRRFILRIDPTNVAGALKNYRPIDPTVGRWVRFIWQFDYKIEWIAGIRNKVDGLSRVCITPEGVEDAEPIDAFFEYEGGTLEVDNEMMGEECASGELLIRTLEKGAPVIVAELREGPVPTRGRKEEKDSWGAIVGPKEELIAMVVEGGREAVMNSVESWERKEL